MSITNKNRIQGIILILVGVSLLIVHKIQGDALVHEELSYLRRENIMKIIKFKKRMKDFIKYGIRLDIVHIIYHI